RTMSAGGISVELLEVIDTSPGEKRWDLKYSKAGRPVARLSRGQEELYLFYQLFRYRSGGDMPDISLRDHFDATGDALGFMDPKFSEKSSYTRAYYQEIAGTYRRKFRPRFFSIVIEYFPRPSLSLSEEDAILDVRPGGAGFDRLLARLRETHNLRPSSMAV